MMSVYLLASAAVLASAEPKPAQPSPAAVAGVFACRAISSAEARLRCYDAAAAALNDAVAKGNVVAMDRQAVTRTRRELFGFSVPRIPLFGTGNEPEQKELNATITRVVPTGFQKWIFTLDTGARWQTTEALSRQNDPKPGQKVEIKRSLMGGYFLSVNGNPPARALRLQ